MKPLVYFLTAITLTGAVRANEEVPLLLPEERNVLQNQSAEVGKALAPTMTTAAKSTVRIWSGSRRVAYGTVVGDGTKVISKWSEVARATGVLRVDAGGDYREVTLDGVYEDEDMVLLTINGSALTPVKWHTEPPALGGFVIAPQPDGKLAAFGVVSVLERNLRDSDMAFLGVIADQTYKGEGVRINEVQRDSGALAAGLKRGDVIMKVRDRSISGLLELKNALVGIPPGTVVPMVIRIDGQDEKVDVLLSNRPDLPTFSGDRLRAMERMGGPLSLVRDSFTHAIQSDIRLAPNQIGGPVVDLKGRPIGVTMARADRTRSFIMPASAIMEMLKKEPQHPDLFRGAPEKQAAQQPLADGRRGPRGRSLPGGEDRLRRHLSEMQRLMDHMRAEMETLENP